MSRQAELTNQMLKGLQERNAQAVGQAVEQFEGLFQNVISRLEAAEGMVGRVPELEKQVTELRQQVILLQHR